MVTALNTVIINAQHVVETDLDYICTSLGSEFARMAGKNLLIAGGAGFLGYYMVQSVVHWNRNHPDRKIRVTVFDSFTRGAPAWLTSLATRNEVTLVRHDVTDPIPANAAAFEYIVHAASIASPTFYRQHPIETMDANVNGLRNFLDYFRQARDREHQIEGLLFYSSSEIYGDPTPENIPTPETYRGNVSCTGPRACYDEAKRYGETLCVNFAQQFDLPIKVARPFNNYGPGLKISDRRVLPDFARDLLANRDIVMLSDGSARRTFCYVADAVTGYYKILVKGRNGESYNIGVEAPEISISEVAEKVASLGRELFGYTGRIVHKASTDANYLVDNPTRRCPDISKARAELGYDPGISLDEGLRRSLLWYSGNSAAEDA